MSAMYVAAGVLCALLAASCATKTVPPDSSIWLSKSKCGGPCPAFRMELYVDGSYLWDGEAHVAAPGTRRGRLGVEAYRQASQLLSDARIDEFRDKYEGGADCETWTTDQQTVVIGVRTSSGTRTITHYLGCEGFARQGELLRLESALEKVLHVKDFAR